MTGGSSSDQATSADATLARFVAEAGPDSIPAAALHAAARSLLDSLGVMAAALREPGSAGLFLARAEALGGKEEAGIFGSPVRVPAQMAAFANGALSHSMDFGDGYPPALVHPHGAVVPAALAVAEATGASYRQLLTAIVLGYDVSVRLALALGTNTGEHPYYHPALVGSIAAATSCAHLQGLSPAQICDAWTLALLNASAPGAIARSDNGNLRGVRDAFGARGGVEAALLAAAGMGGVSDPLTGKGGALAMYGSRTCPEALIDGLGSDYKVLDVAYKIYPSCGATHAFINVIRNLLASGLDVQAIARIEARVSPVFHAALCTPLDEKRRPETAMAAKFSIPFCIAHAFVHGHVRLNSFDRSALQDHAVLAIADRVSCVEDDGIGPLEGSLTFEMADGSQITQDGSALSDHITDAVLSEKFVDCIDFANGDADRDGAGKLANLILRADADMPVSDLLAELNQLL